jgi:hypothetical protein
MTQLGYSRIFFDHIVVGVNWDYYYPKVGNYYNTYGFDDGDDHGIYGDITNKYYAIGASNRIDGYLMFIFGFGGFNSNEDAGYCFFKYQLSKMFMNNMWQIYFNSPANNAKKYYPTDTSVTTFLEESSANKVYYRQESFVGWGQSLSFGAMLSIDKKSQFMIGGELGITNEYMPASAKQSVFINSQEYYYQYTPAWEGRINIDPVYADLLFTYRF